jgi:hypothetical protein
MGAVLESYGVQEDDRWRLREEDSASRRRAELEQVTDLIETIGKRLDYSTERFDKNTCVWKEKRKVVRVFYLVVSAMTGRILTENRYPLEKCLLVIPGGRAGLLAYKEKRDPKLRQQLEGWRIVKFRLMRALVDIPVLNRQTFEEQLASDPVEQTQGQMMMF